MAPDRGEIAVEASLPAQLERLDVRDATSIPTGNDAVPHEPTAESIPAHLSHDPLTNAKRTDPFQFGQRYLNQADDVFEYNAWDHVAPDDEHMTYSEEQYAKQRASPVSDFDRRRFNTNPEKWWDLFYKQKSASFFKDRKWLVQEFPVLGKVTKADAEKKVVLEVGAGAGNTAFPVMRINENPELEIIAADFSKKAVETMRNAEDYAAIQDGRDGRVGKMRAEVWDVAGEALPEGLEEGCVDVIVMIFIFSALNPKQWTKAVENVWRLLKPGGEVLFRDYGRGDLAQVRFKAGRWMEENFYVRGDGTRVYFFERDELEHIWSGAVIAMSCDQDERGAHENKLPCQMPDSGGGAVTPRFDILNLDVDRRLIVNRQRRIKMYRCWMQGQFRKSERI